MYDVIYIKMLTHDTFLPQEFYLWQENNLAQKNGIWKKVLPSFYISC